MDIQIFQYGDYKYEYYLVYEDRKTIRLTVNPNLKIILQCPLSYTEEKIEKFLKRKWNWLEKQIKDLKRFQRNKKDKEYISGESFLYLGRQYKLVVKEADKDNVHFESGKIIIKTSNSNKNKTLLKNWYEKRAEKVFKERYKQMLKKFNYNFTPDLALRKMEKRWGSFLTKKKVLLNPELIKA
ncbi:MAG: M48 family metallopeptidase, partial [Candidatus Peregrinibacteria bacterium]|nr:M48 family metallopeptidase [Candidatus Peregrinibacteria bacterium]